MRNAHTRITHDANIYFYDFLFQTKQPSTRSFTDFLFLSREPRVTGWRVSQNFFINQNYREYFALTVRECSALARSVCIQLSR